MKRLFAAALLGWSASATAWQIDTFDATIRIQPDSSLDITEHIVADFRGDPHHGIFRTIPVNYRDKYGNALSLRLRVTSVSHPFVESSTGRYRKLKIGSAHSLVDGLETYDLTYHIDRAVTFFDGHDELYWNATGNEWPVAIRHASATVILPRPATEDINALAFTGAYGAINGDAAINTDKEHVTYTVRGALRPLEGLTIVAGWSKGLVAPPSTSQRLRWFLADNWPVGLPVATALGLFFWWWSFGRDPRARGAVVVQYEPPLKLSPAEIGTVLDERCDMRDISATIIDLARRGYLQIKEIQREGLLRNSTDYQFVRLKEYRNDSTLLAHEKLVLGGIFGGDSVASLSNLEGSFYSEMPGIREAVYDAVVSNGFFPKSPDNVRGLYRVLGIMIVVLGIAGAFFQFNDHRFPWTVAGALGVAGSGLVLILFAPFLPRKTPAGARLHEDILGFEEYLSRAESAEIQATERQNVFERMLPYAMALGVAALWAKRFEALKLQAPGWYQGVDSGGFRPLIFVNQLNYASNSMNRSLSVAPRSASSGTSSWSGGGSGFGGGFSGGGGGGGGGGAW